MALAKSTIAKRIYERGAKNAPVGTGQRFRALKKAATYLGMRTPAGFTAWRGRKKYGKAEYQEMAYKGRMRALRTKKKK